MGLTAGEALRKALHMAMGFFAMALAHLTWWQAALCALAALAHNLWILPRTAKPVLRGRDLDAGIVLYPVAVLLLILIFPGRLELAAAAWGYLAFGDGSATIVGRIAPIHRPAFAGGKSLGGWLGFIIFGSLGANLLYNYVGGGHGIAPSLLVVGVILASLEMLPMPVNDNLTIPLAAAAMLGLAGIVGPASPPAVTTVILAVAINLGVALLAWVMRIVSMTAVFGGTLVGAAILSFGGVVPYSLLLLFFLLATSATRLGYERKRHAGVAQEGEGRRGAKHALANGAVATALCALLPFVSETESIRVAIAAALATALADTLGSELGQLYGKHPIHPITWRRVPVGTEGAVSIEGTLAGILGSALIAAVPLLFHWYRWAAAAAVLAAAFVGTVAESVLGAFGDWDNEVLNFINTAIGATAGALIIHYIF